MKHKNIPKGYKDSPLGIIPKEWEVKTIGEACDIHVGKDLNLNSYSKECDNTHIYPVYFETQLMQTVGMADITILKNTKVIA